VMLFCFVCLFAFCLFFCLFFFVFLFVGFVFVVTLCPVFGRHFAVEWRFNEKLYIVLALVRPEIERNYISSHVSLCFRTERQISQSKKSFCCFCVLCSDAICCGVAV